jgi:hypothetical protein
MQNFLKGRRFTLILAGLTLAALILSVPGSLREAFDRGGFYLFSLSFFEDIPKRLAGPGRFRFVLQPLTAMILGFANGLADARGGLPPYLYGVLFHRDRRMDLVKSALSAVANLLLMGILLDVIFQRIILGIAYPGAALVVGPVLIVFPYATVRALSNRVSRKIKRFQIR